MFATRAWVFIVGSFASAAAATPYEFTFEGNSSVGIFVNGRLYASSPLSGVTASITGVGDPALAVETRSGTATVRTLHLDHLTFSGFHLADRTLTYTSDPASGNALCIAGTCVSMAGALPPSWWQSPTPIDQMVARDNVFRTAPSGPTRVALEPGRPVPFGNAGSVDTGTVEYSWLLMTFAGPPAPLPLHVLVAPVPEPTTAALAIPGLLTLMVIRRRTKTATV